MDRTEPTDLTQSHGQEVPAASETTETPPPAPSLAWPRDIDPEQIPLALRQVDQWVNWRYELRQKKEEKSGNSSATTPDHGAPPEWTKVPVIPGSRRRASSTNPEQWGTFDRALRSARESQGSIGIGFVFSADDDFAGVDLDDCRDPATGILTCEALKILSEFGTYSEVSPSATGVKLFLLGERPAGSRHRSTMLASVGIGEVEVYTKERFFTVTGERVEGSPLEVSGCQAQLDALCSRLWAAPSTPTANASEERMKMANEAEGADTSELRGGTSATAPSVTSKAPRKRAGGSSDANILKRASSSRQGAKFQALYFKGDLSVYNNDDSRGAAALCAMLAYWTDKDAAQMDRLFRGSALMREKWDEKRGDSTWGVDEIATAIEFCKVTHSGRGQAMSAPSGGPKDEEQLPEILLGPDEHRVADEAIDALARDPRLFRRAESLVRLGRSSTGSACLMELERPTLREKITKQATLLKINSKGILEHAHPPEALAEIIMARANWSQIRELLYVQNTPLLCADGTVITSPGYCASQRAWYEPSVHAIDVPSSPSRADAREAASDLLAVIADFPVASDRDRSVFLAAVLTPVARLAFEGPSPLILFDANVRGSGKSLLAKIAGTIATGDEPAMTSYCNEEELRKAITGTVMRAEPLVVLDNVSGDMGDATLDRMLTSTKWRDRQLGGNKIVDLPMRTTWYATGNNLVLKADTSRRVVTLRLRSPEEFPESRTDFAQPNLLVHVKTRFGKLHAAAVTLLSAFLRSGENPLMPAMGSFEGWSAVVRGAIIWVGLADPVEARGAGSRASDARHEAIARLVASWKSHAPKGAPVLVADLVLAMYRADAEIPDDVLAMKAALEELHEGSGNARLSARDVGAILRSVRERVIDGLHIVSDEKKTAKGSVWRLLTVDGCVPDDCDDSGDSVLAKLGHGTNPFQHDEGSEERIV